MLKAVNFYNCQKWTDQWSLSSCRGNQVKFYQKPQTKIILIIKKLHKGTLVGNDCHHEPIKSSPRLTCWAHSFHAFLLLSNMCKPEVAGVHECGESYMQAHRDVGNRSFCRSTPRSKGNYHLGRSLSNHSLQHKYNLIHFTIELKYSQLYCNNVSFQI